MDTTNKALIETIGAAGYHVLIGAAHGSPVVEAVWERTAERFIVHSERVYETVVEVARQVGIELDGS